MHTASRMPIRTAAAMLLLVAVLAACRPRPPESPPPDPPPPAVPAGMAATEAITNSEPPVLASMALATASSKLGVPVDLRYQFDGEVEPGRPVTLHLAAVPRVAGSNLTVSIKQVAGVEARNGALSVQKASAAASYRQQLAVTRQAGGPRELRVLVTMEMPEGSAFGYYSVPFERRDTESKSDRSEQR